MSINDLGLLPPAKSSAFSTAAHTTGHLQMARLSTDSDDAVFAALDVDVIVAEYRASQEASSQAMGSQEASCSQQGDASQEAPAASQLSLLLDNEDDALADFDLDAAIAASGAVVRHPEFEAICQTDLAPGQREEKGSDPTPFVRSKP